MENFFVYEGKSLVGLTPEVSFLSGKNLFKLKWEKRNSTLIHLLFTSLWWSNNCIRTDYDLILNLLLKVNVNQNIVQREN